MSRFYFHFTMDDEFFPDLVGQGTEFPRSQLVGQVVQPLGDVQQTLRFPTHARSPSSRIAAGWCCGRRHRADEAASH